MILTTVNSSDIIEKIMPHVDADEPGDVRSILDDVCTSPTQEVIDELLVHLTNKMPAYKFSYCRDDGWGFNDLSHIDDNVVEQ